MKRIIFVMLALLLLAGQSAFAMVEPSMADPVWTAEDSGYTLRIPEAYREAKGYITFNDAGDRFDQGSGVVTSSINYCFAAQEEVKSLEAEINDAYMAEDLEKLAMLQDRMGKIQYPLMQICGISRDRGEEELRAWVTAKNLGDVPEEIDEETEALYASGLEYLSSLRFTNLGSRDGLNYFLCRPSPESMGLFFELPKDSAYYAEYISLLEQPELIVDNFTLVGGARLTQLAEIGSVIRFETTDLEGNPLTSGEIFAGHPVTMINMWATWCDPCKDELPALAKMSEEYAPLGCRIIGLCLDADDEETMAEAREILTDTGVTYLNIANFEGREEILPNRSYPTTYFVDENGTVLTKAVVGASLSGYSEILDDLLSGSKK